MDVALRDGIDAAMGVVRRFGSDLTEESLGDAGDGLFVAGKRAEGIALMRQRCELFPSSWHAQVFLADRLLDADDLAGALTGFHKAQQLIASGAKPPPSERVRKMIANGIKRAEGK